MDSLSALGYTSAPDSEAVSRTGASADAPSAPPLREVEPPLQTSQLSTPPAGFFYAAIPSGATPGGKISCKVPDIYPRAGTLLQTTVPDPIPGSRLVLVRIPNAESQANVQAPSQMVLGARVNSPHTVSGFTQSAGIAPPPVQNMMYAPPGGAAGAARGWVHKQDGPGSSKMIQTMQPSVLQTMYNVEPWDTMYCGCGFAAEKRWYFKVQENRIEWNSPKCLFPCCCDEGCICDSVTVKYFDKVRSNLCCGLAGICCEGHFVSYKETMFCCFCCDCHCCYDCFCRPCFGEFVAMALCNNTCMKRCGCAPAVPALTCIKDSEAVAATLNAARQQAKAKADTQLQFSELG